MSKLCVGIAFGGNSAEHEISLESAKNIIHSIDKSRFNIILLIVNKNGQWYLKNSDSIKKDNFNNLFQNILNCSGALVGIIPGNKTKQFININTTQVINQQIDVIFPIFHGINGEDGSIQGMLRMLDIPFVGSDILGSAICMDKEVTKRLLRDKGYHIAPFISFTYEDKNKYNFSDIIHKLGLPLFVKPSNQGSSIGVSKVYNELEFIDAMHTAFKFSYKVLVESNIQGREIECAVLGNSYPEVSSCYGEIDSNKNFYSYNNKYIQVSNKIKLIIPAVLDNNMYDTIKDIVIGVYKTLNCMGMARVDIFLTPHNKVVINEINTLPGFTNKSMYPKLWQASGFSCTEIISKLIELALEYHAYNNSLNKIYKA